MALIDKLLLRGPEEIARAEAKRDFKSVFKDRGLLEERGLAFYYDKRFGQYSSKLDKWEPGNAGIFNANPQLRRVDMVADFIFMDGVYTLSRMGEIISSRNEIEGSIAVVKLRDHDRRLSAMLTLDVGGDVRFTKLRVGDAMTEKVFVVRPSFMDWGMVIEADQDIGPRRELPLSVHEPSDKPIGVFQTVTEVVDALKIILGLN